MSEILRPPEDFILRFTLEGVKYALENNIYDEQSRHELKCNLKFWFPDAVIDEIED